jgi:hypothetical protein
MSTKKVQRKISTKFRLISRTTGISQNEIYSSALISYFAKWENQLPRSSYSLLHTYRAICSLKPSFYPPSNDFTVDQKGNASLGNSCYCYFKTRQILLHCKTASTKKNYASNGPTLSFAVTKFLIDFPKKFMKVSKVIFGFRFEEKIHARKSGVSIKTFSS